MNGSTTANRTVKHEGFGIGADHVDGMSPTACDADRVVRARSDRDRCCSG